MTRREYLPFGKPNFSDQEIAAVTRVLRSGWVGMGPETLAFERELADYLGAPHVVTVNSCTSALFLSLLVSGVGQGDEVICPSLTWCSTANAALYLGAKPVFCDIDRDTLCPTVEQVLVRVTPRTSAVMVVHFGGLAVDVEALREALPARVVIIEDAAHALGARFAGGKRVGSSGNLTCFSFYANKNISTGEGGAVALFDGSQAERLQSLRQHALPLDAWKRFTHSSTLLLSNPLSELGYKMNYTDLQACIGRVQLARQGELDGIRMDIARRYVDGLKELSPSLVFQRDCTHPYHARHLFVLQLPDGMQFVRDDLLHALRARNIGASIHYAPLHLMPLYAEADPPSVFPVTEQLAKRLISLPISSSMTLDDADDVLAQFKLTFEERRMASRARGKESPIRYGFYDRLKAEFPSQLIVDATEVCNLACIHCPHPQFKKSRHYAGRMLDPELNAKLVDEVREYGRGSTQYIRYTGEGEPLIHPHGYEMIEYACRHSGVFVTITTNGTIMNQQRTERLLASGVHLIDISLDAFKPETYAQVRVNGELDVTRANVLRLIEWVKASGSKTKVVVSFVEQPQNAAEAPDFEKFWRDHGADHVVVRRLHSGAGAVASIAERMRDEGTAVARYPCLYPWERILLNPRGQLAFCPQDWVNGSAIADYRTSTIRELWQGEFYRGLREAHLSNEFSKHAFCGQCPDWRSTRWPDQGRSYADLVEELKQAQ